MSIIVKNSDLEARRFKKTPSLANGVRVQQAYIKDIQENHRKYEEGIHQLEQCLSDFVSGIKEIYSMSDEEILRKSRDG